MSTNEEISREKFVDNFLSVLKKTLLSDLPKKGNNWDMVRLGHIIVRNKLAHIQEQIEVVERGV